MHKNAIAVEGVFPRLSLLTGITSLAKSVLAGRTLRSGSAELYGQAARAL